MGRAIACRVEPVGGAAYQSCRAAKMAAGRKHRMIAAIIRAGVTLLAALAFSLAATAEQMRLPTSPDIVMTNPASRDGLDLSGSWAWSVDPYRDGLAGFHGSEAGKGHRRYDVEDVDAATRADPAALYEYDMRRVPRTTLPSSTNEEYIVSS